jgi:hypothetical protein
MIGLRSGLALTALLAVLFAGAPAHAYDHPVHKAIAERAALASLEAQDTLRALGLPEGVRTPLLADRLLLSADEWAGQGAALEDKPDLRVLNHFHDPRRGWGEAGLQVLLIQVGQSSALWHQNASQDPNGARGGAWSWHDARRRLRLALTNKD